MLVLPFQDDAGIVRTIARCQQLPLELGVLPPVILVVPPRNRDRRSSSLGSENSSLLTWFQIAKFIARKNAIISRVVLIPGEVWICPKNPYLDGKGLRNGFSTQ